MELPGLVVLLPLGGVILGALLQHWLSGKKQARDELLQTRTKAYADYLSGVSRKGRLSLEQCDECRQVLGDIDDAKFRICVYGSDAVICALANFEGSPAGTRDVELRKRFLELCRIMRKDSGSGRKVDLPTLYLAVHGAHWPGSTVSVPTKPETKPNEGIHPTAAEDAGGG
ncbi:MAG: hypothetical protein AAB403_15730 [Planctomycetota bacterium]